MQEKTQRSKIPAIPRITVPVNSTPNNDLKLLHRNHLNLWISHHSLPAHKIYEYLDANGLSEENCSIYFKNARAQQQVLVQHFRAQGWSEEQLKAFNEACDSKLPEQFSVPPATNHQWRVKLVEELDRRKNWR